MSMHPFKRPASTLRRNRGANVMGYSLATGLIAVVSLLVVTDSGQSILNILTGVSEDLEEAQAPGQPQGATLSVDQASVTGMDVAGPGSPATGTPVTFTFTNNGGVATGTLSTSNDNTTNFAITNDTCDSATLAAAQSCTVEITPQASSGSGEVTATLSVGDGSLSASASLSGTITGFPLFSFTTFTFTDCGQSGPTGPTLIQCRSSYATSWDEDDNFFNMTTQGYQIWTVPEDGNYTFQAYGANGGNSDTYNGGWRGSVTGDFALTAGDKIIIVVGQQGTTDNDCGGGGGATWLALGANQATATLLLVSSGSGGAGNSGGGGYDSGMTTAAAGSRGSGVGGTGGNGGFGDGGWGSGGAGFSGHGTSSGVYGTDAQSFQTTSIGGIRGPAGGCTGADGGFGGGAVGQNNGGGGGGGYNGGAGGGGAGGSYNTGSNQSSGTLSGYLNDGYVTITKL